MVLTVEPGLYLPDDPSIPARYRGIGIRCVKFCNVYNSVIASICKVYIGKPNAVRPACVVKDIAMRCACSARITGCSRGLPPQTLYTRIEDDVAVTADGYHVLTEACPKTVADVEAICHNSASNVADKLLPTNSGNDLYPWRYF